MSSNWTEEQQSAINIRDKSIIVSAAAGSGKTSVLVERLIRQLADSQNPIPAETMIVVTFTKNSASEMKQRLTVALSELIEQNPDNIWLCQQQAMLQSAKISTIHSFCFNLIKDNLQTLDISAGVRMIEETEEELLEQQCALELIEKIYKTNPDYMKTLFNYFCYKNDKDIEETIILPLYKFMMSIPFSEIWLENVCDKYTSKEYIKKYLDIQIKNVTAKLNSAINMATEAYNILVSEGLIKPQSIIGQEIATITEIKKLFESDEVIEKVKLLKSIKFETLRIDNKEKDPILEQKKVSVQSLRDAYKQIIKDIIDNDIANISRFEYDVHIQYEILMILKDMVYKLNKLIWRVKTEKNIIGFNDAEQLAVKLLADTDTDGKIIKTKLANELSDYYNIIMIDEFQDSNSNQDLIFKMLSKNGTASNCGENMFVVGDVKQSIYRFRRANPQIFIDTQQNSEIYSESSTSKNICVKLNKNFRSSGEVISFVNFIFENIMSIATGEIDYNNEEKLVQGIAFPDNGYSRNTEIALIKREEGDKRNYEAIYVAGKIKEMLNNKYPVITKDGTTRPCQPKDFCILMRGRGHASEFLAELEKNNISAYSEEKTGYLKSREISLLLNLLRVIDNPLLDTALASVMLSPMFMLSADDITQIKIADKGTFLYSSLCVAIGENSIQKLADNGEIIYEKLPPIFEGKMLERASRVYKTISELRMYSSGYTVEELIRKIYFDTDFLSVMQVHSDSEKKRANLRVLLEYTKIYEKSTNGGLSGFIQYIDRVMKMKKETFKQGSAVSVTDDVVTIKTIHQSKGLEYPFIFLVETDTQFNKMDSYKAMQIDYEMGIGFKLQNVETFEKYTTLIYDVINDINIKHNMSEEMRLLYVALTRAKEKLFIPLDLTKSISTLDNMIRNIYTNKGISNELISSVNSMGEWLAMSLLIHKDAGLLREFACGENNQQNFYIEDTDFDIDMYKFNLEAFDVETLAEAEDTAEIINPISPNANRSLYLELKNMINFKYTDERFSKLQAKVTVSEIAKEQDDFIKVLNRPKFMSEVSGLTGAERGTALHTFLQYADLSRLKQNPSAEIQKSVKMGFITKVQAESINIKKLTYFIESPLFKRIEKSDRVLRERKFLLKISDLDLPVNLKELSDTYKNTDTMIQGIIDLAFEENGEMVVVDYKTDYTESAEDIIPLYKNQLLIYKYALEEIEHKPVKQTILYAFGLNQSIDIK